MLSCAFLLVVAFFEGMLLVLVLLACLFFVVAADGQRRERGALAGCWGTLSFWLLTTNKFLLCCVSPLERHSVPISPRQVDLSMSPS